MIYSSGSNPKPTPSLLHVGAGVCLPAIRGESRTSGRLLGNAVEPEMRSAMKGRRIGRRILVFGSGVSGVETEREGRTGLPTIGNSLKVTRS